MSRGVDKIVIIVLLLLSVSSCKKSEQFKVEGAVAGANQKVLYLEQLELDKTIILDSVKLSDQGKFSFKHEVPSTPDYYRLRLDSQVIPFSISEPVTLTVAADKESFQISYTIEGSRDAKQIREVWLTQLDTDRELKHLIDKYNDGGLSLYDFALERDSILGLYKNVATKYIYNDPGSAAAYFALFQQVDGNLIFNIYDKTDSKAFAAVANLHLHNYPESPRTKHLEKLALRSMAVLRAQKKQKEDAGVANEMVSSHKVEEVSYIDFELPDNHGNQVALSSIVAQSPTLLCFSTMEANWSPAAIEQLAGIYEVYTKKGLKIVQVSLDRDPHVWQSVSEKLPWINLQEKNGGYSQLVGYYNLSSLPTLFLFEKGGEVMHRITTSEQLVALLNRL